MPMVTFQVACILLGTLFLSLPGIALPQEQEFPSSQAPASPAYAESAEGLQQLVEDVLAAIEQGDERIPSALLQGLILPDFEEWFVQAFGEQDGHALARVYETRIPEYVPRLRSFLGKMAQNPDLRLRVEKVPESPGPEPHRVMDALRKSLRGPVSFYVADFLNPSNSGPNFGYFVYIDGGFRHVDVGVLSALSALKPKHVFVGHDTQAIPRIRLGSASLKDRLVQRVDPRYPEEAVRQGIEGTVELEIRVGTDGIVREAKVVAGDPLLGRAAIEAVKQWRYRPVELNGRAVEVLGNVSVVFVLIE